MRALGYGFDVRLSAWLGFLLLVACGQPSTSREVRTAPPVAPAGPRPQAAPPAREGSALLEQLPTEGFSAAQFRITSPAPGRRVELEQAPHLLLAVEGARGALRVALDGHAFRSIDDATLRPGALPPGALPPGALPLGALLLEDEEIAPGPHRVVVVAEGAEGRALAATWFWVDDPNGPALASSPAPPPPGVVLLSPRGTFHGAAADAVHVEAVLLTPAAYVGDDGRASAESPIDDAATLEVKLSGISPGNRAVSGRASGRAGLRATARLDSGDYVVEASGPPRANSVAGPWQRALRTITVNRDSGSGAQ